VDLHDALIALHPDWASGKDDAAEAEKGKALGGHISPIRGWATRSKFRT
jgi:hypothetical protein